MDPGLNYPATPQLGTIPLLISTLSKTEEYASPLFCLDPCAVLVL